MIFAGKKIQDNYQIKLYINDEEIVKVSSTCYLGVIIDDKPSWREQVGLVCNKISKSLGILRKTIVFVQNSCLLILYYSLIYPYLTYCNIVWASTFSSYLYTILLLYKKFARLATFSKVVVPSAPLFYKLKFLSIFFFIFSKSAQGEN